ncbi:MAG: hypothetical protein ACPGPS_21060, partial [Rubripirellula sp.]
SGQVWRKKAPTQAQSGGLIRSWLRQRLGLTRLIATAGYNITSRPSASEASISPNLPPASLLAQPETVC